MPSAALHPRRCWFKHNLAGAGECEGSLFRVHLIPRQLIKREAPGADEMDPRTWVPGCGGLTGTGGHHGRLDSRGCDPLRVPRRLLPGPVEEFAREYGLGWFLDREYGPVSIEWGGAVGGGRADDFDGCVD